MATKKVGVLVKEARTAADLTQEKLAKKAGEGLTANDISKCEQQKADLTAAQLKAIAKVCGVTQTSLVNAPKNLSAAAAKKAAAEKKTATTAAKKAAAEKKTATTAAKKTSSTAKKETEKKTSSTAKKTTEKKTAEKKPTTPVNANTSMKVTTTEKKLVEAYRTATSDNKKIALKILKGEMNETVTNLLGAATGSSSSAGGLGDILGDALAGLFGGK